MSPNNCYDFFGSILGNFVWVHVTKSARFNPHTIGTTIFIDNYVFGSHCSFSLSSLEIWLMNRCVTLSRVRTFHSLVLATSSAIFLFCIWIIDIPFMKSTSFMMRIKPVRHVLPISCKMHIHLTISPTYSR